MDEKQKADIFESFANALPFGVLLLNSRRTAMCWNLRAEQITGFLRHEVIGRRCAELAMFGCEGRDHSARESTECPLRSMIRNVRLSAPHFQLQHKEGHSVPVTISLLQLAGEGNEAAAAVIFQEKSAGRELRQWMSRAQSYADDELGIPPIAASRDELQLSARDSNTAVMLIEVLDAQQMARHFGRELLHNGLRNVVRSVSTLVDVPNFLGHWTAGCLLLLVPNCEDRKVAVIAEQIEMASIKNGIRWWGDIVTMQVRVQRVTLEENDSVQMIEKKLEQCRTKVASDEE
jgi:GGDEF domain-containing protein